MALEVFEGWGSHGERGARAYNGGLGAEPQRGPGAKSQGGEAPLKLKAGRFLNVPRSGKTYPVVSFLAKCSIGTWYRTDLVPKFSVYDAALYIYIDLFYK